MNNPGYRAADLDRAGVAMALEPVRAAMTEALTEGATAGHPVAQSLGRSLITLEPARWTFVTVPGVEPMNNRAAQALRPAVLWRTGSFGTHRAAGRRFGERMLTITTSCRTQQRPLVDFLVVAVTAQRTAAPPPSLITPAASAERLRGNPSQRRECHHLALDNRRRAPTPACRSP